jgi:glycine hydroxymethyltransferase
MLKETDEAVYKIIKKEELRQEQCLCMIPSENFFSPSVREAVGSVFSHKYAEGNIGARYYEGNQNVDELEQLAINRAKQAFKLPDDWGVNVQALSGSSANLAVYLALLEIGDKMMAMYLPDGGHLSHGWSFEPDEKKRNEQNKQSAYLGGSRRVNITSKMFKTVQYKTDPKTRMFDYNEVEKLAVEHKPKLLITGGTAYPRDIDYQRMRQIADTVGAVYLADIAHEAGLIAAGVLPSPVGIADVVTMTTHKTLRAGRGALILAPNDLISKINRAVMPGLQGGPFNHSIAGICVGLGEALTPQFEEYAKHVIVNAQTLGRELNKLGFNIVSGGTDKHLLLIDLTDKPLLGKKFARALDLAGIVTNANSMPQEKRGPADPSALRLGTPWLTGRGMGEEEMALIATWINEVMQVCAELKDLSASDFEKELSELQALKDISEQVKLLCKKFPQKKTVKAGSVMSI